MRSPWILQKFVCLTFNLIADCWDLHSQNAYIHQPFQVIGHLVFVFGIGRLRLHGERLYVVIS